MQYNSYFVHLLTRFSHYYVLGGCEKEHVSLSDISGNILHKFCGFQLPPAGPLNITSNELVVEFCTSELVLYSSMGRGFQMHYISEYNVTI